MIRFRPVVLSDVPWIAEALSYETVARNTSTIPHPLDENFVRSWVSDWKQLEAAGQGFRMVGITDDGDGFGSAAIKRTTATTGELSFWIAPRFWRQGLASQMSKAIVEQAGVAGFTRPTVGHFRDNAGSAAVLRKLGFRRLDQDMEVFSLSRNENLSTFRYALDLES